MSTSTNGENATGSSVDAEDQKTEDIPLPDRDEQIVFVRTGEGEEDETDESLDDSYLIREYERAMSRYTKHLDEKAGKSGGDSAATRKNKSGKSKKPRSQGWALGEAVMAPYSEDGEWYEAVIEGLDVGNGVARVTFIGYEDDGEDEVDMAELKKMPKGAVGYYMTPDGAKVREKQEPRNVIPSPPSQPFCQEWVPGQHCMVQYLENGRWYECEILSIDEKDETCRVSYLDTGDEEERSLAELAGLPAAGERPGSRGSSFGAQPQYAPMIPPPPPPPGILSGRPQNMDEVLQPMLMSWYMSGYHSGYFQAFRDLKLGDGNRR